MGWRMEWMPWVGCMKVGKPVVGMVVVEIHEDCQ